MIYGKEIFGWGLLSFLTLCFIFPLIIFASKGMGAEWVASYYNIPLSHTIAFGNL